ncbi:MULTISPECIES: YncE family protein [Pseudomonas]|uniref:YncE family protein n=1 Tax=Pseudomonas TaxID=286 RepID=UPI000B351B4C|nr:MULTISPECIES: beta-propeller fold lactonase family protein [Pseudomonas]PMY59740.1 hypothetical protein C1Y31_30510 [Pseudomonas sp. FW305-25]PMY61243.1 hypothetical protein C1Y32_30110 [Pseudomonas sp. FW126-L8]PNA75770.1 hypothetical protein C1Y33_21595 [Pseudomonas sp. FW305-76]
MAIEFYSTDTDQGTISVIRKDDHGYQVVKQIKVGNAPRGSVKFTKAGRGFVSNTSGCTVSELDPFNHREVQRITVGMGPRGIGIIPGDRYMLVSNSGSDTMSLVDLSISKEVLQLPVGRDPRHLGITKDGNWAYVCIWGDSYISKLDLSSLKENVVEGVKEVARIELPENSNPYSLNIDPSGRFALVACNATDHVPVIALDSDTVQYRVDVDCDDGLCGARAVAFSSDGQFAFVTLERTNAVAVISLETFSIQRYIQAGSAPRGIIQDNDMIVISNFSRVLMGAVAVNSVKLIPHSITFVNLKGIDIASKVAMPASSYSQTRVGNGPCSISMFDPATVLLGNRSNLQMTVEA